MEEEQEYTNVIAVMNDFANEFVERYRQELKSRGHEASGQLNNNMTWHRRTTTATLNIDLEIADYFYYIENGRGPTKNGNNGGPTVHEKIVDWLQQKGITPHNEKNLPTERALDSFAWAITKRIHKEGTSIYRNGGEHIIENLVKELTDKYKPLLDAALEKDFEEFYAIKILTKINRMIKI